MDTRYLESLLLVVETGSIAGAARRQNLTAAAISQRISALERDLGAVLLLRSARSARPSPHCLQILDECRDLVRTARLLCAGSTEGAPAGPLRLGAISTAMSELMPDTLVQLRDLGPDLRIRLQPGTSAALYEMVRDDLLDAAMIVAPPMPLPKELQTVPLRREPLGLLLPPNVAPAPLPALVAGNELIRYDAASWGGQIVADYLVSQRLVPQVFCDLDGIEAISLMVARGLGIALLPIWTPGLDWHDPPEAGAFGRDIVLLYRADAARLPAIRALRQVVAGPGKAARAS